MHRMDVVLIIRHRQEDTITLVVVVSMRNTVVVPIKLLLLKDLSSKDAIVVRINLVVVQMASLFPRVHMAMDVIAHKQNINVVQMVLQLLKVQTLKDARVPPANMDVVQMVSLMHKVHNSMVVTLYQPFHRKHVVLIKMVEHAVTIRLNISLIWNMVAVPDSGTAAVVVTKIATNHWKTAKIYAKLPSEKMHAWYRKYMDHAQDIRLHITMIRIAIFAHSLSMVVALETLIDSKVSRTVKSFAL